VGPPLTFTPGWSATRSEAGPPTLALPAAASSRVEAGRIVSAADGAASVRVEIAALPSRPELVHAVLVVGAEVLADPAAEPAQPADARPATVMRGAEAPVVTGGKVIAIGRRAAAAG